MSSTFAWARQELKVHWDGLPRPSSAEAAACFQPAYNRAADPHRRVPLCSSIPL